jgi:hypothetical protein
LLTLMRRQIIVVTQHELFGSITLSRPNVASDPRSRSSPFGLHQTNDPRQAG